MIGKKPMCLVHFDSRVTLGRVPPREVWGVGNGAWGLG